MFFYLILNSRTFVITLGKKYEYLHSLTGEELNTELETLA
jgi:hypothetical protein